MEGEPEEGSFEGLMEAGHEAVDDHFDPNTITHAMITPDGTTVPITLNPETGKHKEAFSTLVQSLVQMTCIDFTIFLKLAELQLFSYGKQWKVHYLC